MEGWRNDDCLRSSVIIIISFYCKLDRRKNITKLQYSITLYNKSVNVCVNHTLDKVFPVIIISNGYYSIVCPGLKVV